MKYHLKLIKIKLIKVKKMKKKITKKMIVIVRIFKAKIN